MEGCTLFDFFTDIRGHHRGCAGITAAIPADNRGQGCSRAAAVINRGCGTGANFLELYPARPFNLVLDLQ